MERVADRPMVNAVLVEAARIAPEERRTRIVRCVAEGRHDAQKLPLCIASDQRLVRYCDQCWSVIDPYGLTWNWAPQPENARTQ
jgi:hypothetical protein